jgi:lipoate-protein ligase A
MSHELLVDEYRGEQAMVEATARDGQPRRRVYRVPEPVVVLGRGSRPELELDLEACRRDGIPILRRRGGGCAVLLDPGNLIVAVSLRVPGLGANLEHFRRLSAWLLEALGRVGCPGVRREGPSDLVLGTRKVSGACIHRSRDLLHYGASLLVSPRVELMERYLRHPPREPEYRRGRSHRAFVGALLPGASEAELARLERALEAELRLEELRALPGEAAALQAR